jgi:hypothetical protein
VPRPSLPSSSGPGRRPLTAKTGVRVPLGAPETSGIIGFSAGLRLGYPGGLSGRLARLNEGGTLFMASRARVSRRMKDSPALMRGLWNRHAASGALPQRDSDDRAPSSRSLNSPPRPIRRPRPPSSRPLSPPGPRGSRSCSPTIPSKSPICQRTDQVRLQ